MSKALLIPFVCGAGASTAGSEQGAIDLYQRGLHEELGADWIENPEDVFAGEYGEKAHESLPPLGSEERKEMVFHHCRYLRDKVAEAVEQGVLPVTLGGDHSMAAGSIAGLAQAKQAHGKIGVIWVDAHPDLNTDESSYSDAYHGMPVAALFGMGDPDFAAIGESETAVLDPHHIFYIGIRDIDPAEQKYMDRLGIQGLTNEQVAECGMEEAFMRAYEHVSKDTDYLVLSIDLDGLDPKDAPSVGTPVDGGLRLNEVLPVLGRLAERTDFDLLEIAEYNPTLGGGDKTYETIKKLLEVLLVNKCGNRHQAEADQFCA